MFDILLLLLAAHALCDYPLQGEFLAKGKNHKAAIPGIPFYHPLLAHSAIHAAAVGLITGSTILALLEFTIHTITDYSKCDNKISFNTDQAIHITCKICWVIMLGTLL